MARWVSSVLAVAALMAVPIGAHHGDAGRYDEEVITVTGTVVALQMVNPHSHIVFDVVNHGKTVRWQAELGTPQQLIKQFGWTPTTVHAGMKLTMIGRQLKGGAPYLNLTERANIVVSATGQEIYRTENFGKPAPAKGLKGSLVAQ
jgi:cytosine/adenosine deaminase-related metal-dependent hydrolase